MGRHRGAVALLLALVATMVACLAAGVASPTAEAAGPCTDVEVVGLRGSSEEYLGSEHDMGSLLGPVADTIATQLSGSVTFGFYGVPYRAADAISGVLTGDYFASKEEGSELLHDHLLQRAIECPATKFVVMGYSQGAHAAGDQLAHEDTFLTDRIAAFIMFGDPRFNPEADYDWGSYDPRDHGLAGARSLSDFSSWSSRVFSFCHQNDLICQGGGWGHGTDAHSQEKYVNDYADLVAGLVRRKLGLTELPRVPLDLAFVIDSTGSMFSSIDGVREAVSSIVAKLQEKESDFRLALVDYKDTDQGDPYASQVDLDISPDASAFESALYGLSVYGGGDYEEAVYSGLMTAFTGLSWRSGSRKAVILMGDAPAKDPEPVTGYTLASVLAAAHAIGASGSSSAAAAKPAAIAAAGLLGDSAAIYPLAVGEGPLESFTPLAGGTGGRLFTASDPSAVSGEVVEAVDTAASPVEVALSRPSPARPGSPVAFAAQAAYAGGEIADYEWDFDSDGVIDETTSSGRVTHVYPAPLDGTAEVIAVAADGHRGSATAPVSISDSAPLAASPPSGLEATSPAPNSLHLSWQPPADLGGGTLLAFQLVVEDQTSNEIVAAGGLDGSARQLDLHSLPAGRYSSILVAVTEAGPGDEARAGISVADPQSQGATGAGAASTATLPTASGETFGRCVAVANRAFRKARKSAKRRHGKRRARALRAARRRRARRIGACRAKFGKHGHSRAAHRRHRKAHHHHRRRNGR